jgi:small subunit ribosomal protein S2
MVVVDVRREVNALREAQKLGIPTVCLIDTDSDPDLADLPIPGNDDAMRAIEIVIGELTAAITEGKSARAQADLERKTQGGGGDAGGRRRSSRSQFRAEGAPAEGAAEAPAPAAEAAAPAPAPAPEAPAAEQPASAPQQ